MTSLPGAVCVNCTPAKSPRGVSCPTCLSPRTRVRFTRRKPGATSVRVRVCRDCGQRFKTAEKALPLPANVPR